MPTFKELAERYALQAKAAVREDGFSKTAASSIKFSDLPRTAILKVAKEISADLGRYTKGGLPLTEEDRKTILEIAGVELELSDPADFYWLIKGGSNDAYMQMITYVGNLVKKAGR